MRDLIKSLLSFSWGMSLFGARQLAGLATPRRPEGAPGEVESALDAVTRAAEAQMGELEASLFREGDRLQRQAVDLLFGALGGGGTAGGGAFSGGAVPAVPPAETAERPDPGRLDPGVLVVLGEGLAAGIADFGLKSDLQRESFPAQVARQMGTRFRQPLVQPPGIGDLPGFPRLPVRLPALMQTTVLEEYPPAAPPHNLAIPGFHLADALELRPAQPLVHRDDAKQTAANLILDLPGLMRGERELPTQLEAALRQQPTLALVELGYAEALEAAAAGEPQRLPSAADFRARCGRLLAALRGAGAEVVLLSVPDPLDTAFLSSPTAAGRVLRVEPAALAARYGLAEGDRLTVPGLVEIGCQLLGGAPRPLPEGCVLPAGAAAALAARVGEWNASLAELAGAHGAHLCDLHALFREVREQGVTAGSRRLSADFLGGFYALNGCYPGRTGHALIANQVLALLNRVYGACSPLVDLARAASADPVARYRAPEGPLRAELPPPPPSPQSYVAAAPTREPSGADDGSWPPPPPRPGRLQLPPGLEQTLPLSTRASYYGDAIRIVHCPDERDARFGSCGDLFFGGLVLFDAHLSGNAHIRFSPPVGDVAHFELRLGDGLVADDDGVLAAPQFFRWPVLQGRVMDDPAMVSAGDLNLATGEVANLQVFVHFRNSALFGLVRANPSFPTQPISYPGQYGSAWARFDPRPDGLLDFSFYGSMFLPLGARLGENPVLWALPFSSPALDDFASMPASGMAMHPHLCLSTREPHGQPAAAAAGGPALELPVNTVREFTLVTRNSSFGDQFTLNTPELGGYAKGRSQLMGRLEIQFGERTRYSQSVAVSALAPGGLLAGVAAPPLVQVFPGRLYPGPIGHDEFLRYPLRTYFLDAVNFIDDPFDLAAGAVDLATGNLITELLRRGFIGQNVFYALVRVEPRTPQSSFFFRGPARFQRGADGRIAFRLKAEVHIPYPEGFLYPAPDLASAFPIEAKSALDPFLWFQAREDARAPAASARGEARRLRASNGEEFSYLYSIAADPRREAPFFEYVNHSQQGSFRLHSLAWFGFANALDAAPPEGGFDTVTFSGFGVWTKDGISTQQQATVQIANPPRVPYVSIQIAGGEVSNVNTKPADERDVLP